MGEHQQSMSVITAPPTDLLGRYLNNTRQMNGPMKRKLKSRRTHSQLTQDIVTFTHAKPQKQKWDPRTKSWTTSLIDARLRASMRGTLAGQDYVLVLHPVPGDVRQAMVLVLDGHGDCGELFSVHAGEFLSRLIENKWSTIRSHCYSDEHTRDEHMRELSKDAFRQTDEYLFRELGTSSGGTTATVVMIVDGQFVITANVGDSPALLAFNDGRNYLTLTESHSADSPQEYVRYRARCARDGVTPAKFVYNRFNCQGGHRLPGPNGNFMPIPIFELDECNNAVPIERNCAYVASLGYHGGIQTVRKHVVRDGSGKAVDTELDKRYLNWGSTVAGRPQNTRMLGDFEDKAMLHLDAEPSVSVVHIDRSMGAAWLVVASDGVGDAHWFETMTGQVSERARAGMNSAQAQCEALIKDTIANAREAKFNFKDDLPAWDDLSLTLIGLPKEGDEEQHTCSEHTPMDCEGDAEHGPIRRKRSTGTCSGSGSGSGLASPASSSDSCKLSPASGG